MFTPKRGSIVSTMPRGEGHGYVMNALLLGSIDIEGIFLCS